MDRPDVGGRKASGETLATPTKKGIRGVGDEPAKQARGAGAGEASHLLVPRDGATSLQDLCAGASAESSGEQRRAGAPETRLPREAVHAQRRGELSITWKARVWTLCIPRISTASGPRVHDGSGVPLQPDTLNRVETTSLDALRRAVRRAKGHRCARR